MNVDLTGKVAVITGSSRGIGRGCAIEMARAGAEVTVNYFSHPDDAEETAALVRSHGREALVVQGDVSDRGAVDHMARTIANDLTEHRIRVNVIQPGWIDTPGERQFATEEEIQEGARTNPWGRLGTMEDIGRAATFLCSDAADYITGTSLTVDGGITLPR